MVLPAPVISQKAALQLGTLHPACKPPCRWSSSRSCPGSALSKPRLSSNPTNSSPPTRFPPRRIGIYLLKFMPPRGLQCHYDIKHFPQCNPGTCVQEGLAVSTALRSSGWSTLCNSTWALASNVVFMRSVIHSIFHLWIKPELHIPSSPIETHRKPPLGFAGALTGAC